MVLLAVELVHSILENIDDRRDLISCRLVSKSFEGAASPIVWKRLCLRKSRIASGNQIPFQDLSTSTYISQYVKEITYDTTDLTYPNPIFKNIPGSLQDFDFFRNFHNLDTLRILFPAYGSEYLGPLNEDDEDFDFENHDYLANDCVTPERKLRSEIFKKLSHLHLEHGFTIRNLEFRNIYPVSHTGMRAEGLQSFLKSVKRLGISLAEVDSDIECGSYFPASDYYEIFKSEITTFLKASTELESLTYEGDRYAHGLNDAQWDSLSYGKLKSLCIGDVVYNHFSQNTPTSFSRFILRHKDTLQELHMYSCMIDAENVPNIITWGELFGSFKDNLRKLRQFKFDPLPGRDETDEEYFRGYAWWDTEGGYSEYSNPEDGDFVDAAADRVALAAFQEELSTRSQTQGSNQM